VSKALVIAVSLGVGFLGFPAHSAISKVVGTKVHSQSGGASTSGGCDARINASAELFHPGTSQVNASWASTGELNIGRYAHTATLLHDGKVLVAGGRGSDNCFAPTNSAELYDPASGTWTLTGSLTTARAHHTATLLQNGMVLVAGGRGDGPLNSAELYDPGTGTWHPTGSFKRIQILRSSTSPQLPNGKVLVVGKTSDSALEAELYDPETGAWRSTTSPYDDVAHLLLIPADRV
jgi:hypothetical protein